MSSDATLMHISIIARESSSGFDAKIYTRQTTPDRCRRFGYTSDFGIYDPGGWTREMVECGKRCCHDPTIMYMY